MQCFSAAGSPPDPRSPETFIVVLCKGLLIALLFFGIQGASAATMGPDATPHAGMWVPPIEAAHETDVLTPFVPPDMPWSSAHRGIDVATSSTKVFAPAGGEVTFVGVVVDRPVISIRHNNGFVSSLEPVTSDLAIGDSVSQGQNVGELADESPHCATQCVHWGVRKPDAWQVGSTTRDLYIDPAFLLGWTEPSVLWPVHSAPPLLSSSSGATSMDILGKAKKRLG